MYKAGQKNGVPMSRFHKLFVALSFAILLISSPLPAAAQKFTAPQLIELAKSQKYEAAGALGRRVQALADVIFAPPVANYRARLKEGLVMLGVMEHSYVREPLLPISDSERSRLRDALVEAGLLAPSGLARVAS